VKKLAQCVNLFDLTNMILPVVCVFMFSLAAVAQTSATPLTTSASSTVPLPHVQFKVAPMPQPRDGRGYAYSLCTGQVIPDAAIWGRYGVHEHVTPAKGLKYDTAHPCGPFSDSVNPMVSGGNPPYHFRSIRVDFRPLACTLV
jgi:hypothetical protein